MFHQQAGRLSRISKLVQNHFIVIPPTKTTQQISREAWLVPGVIPFNRWLCMPAAFIIQFCRHFVFCWSIFNKPIDALIYGSSQAGMAPVTFYIAVGMQGLSAVLVGPLLERHGPQMVTILGGALFCTGSLLTALALSLRQIWLVYLGYGVIVGSSIGICFIAPVSTLQKWFPDRRGLASGVAVWGVGVGGIVNVKLGMYLMKTVGLQQTFVVIGLVYFALIFVSGLVLRTPPPEYIPEGHRYDMQDKAFVEIKQEWTLAEATSSKQFWLIYSAFFANVLFGLVSMSRFSNMITDLFSKTPEHASTIMAIYGGIDLMSRIIIPVISEYTGKKAVYVLSLTMQLVVLASSYFILSTQSYSLFLVSMFTIAVCYGGGFGTISAFLTERFGIGNVGPLFGIIVTACSLVGIIGGVVSTVIFKTFGGDGTIPTPYYVNSLWMLIIVFVGWMASLLIKPLEDHASPSEMWNFHHIQRQLQIV